jgi:hypothetical protein
MFKFFILLALYFSSTISSLVKISFSEEQDKIMTIYNNLNASKREISGHYLRKNFQGHFASMLSLDSEILFKEMCEVTDKIFLFTFWDSLNTDSVYLCNDQYNRKSRKDFKDFIAQVSSSNSNQPTASDMLYNFKAFLMQALATNQNNKVEILLKAEEFFILRFKDLILEVLDGASRSIRLRDQIKEMYQNFRFYHQCTEKENLKSMVIREFQKFKRALKANNENLIRIHTENMAFIAGILMHDRSSICGLKVIADQSPEFIGYFLLTQYYKKNLFRWPSLIIETEPKNYQYYLLSFLSMQIPVFEDYSLKPIGYRKFKPLKEFTTKYDEILKKEDLVDLARTLCKKIVSIQ